MRKPMVYVAGPLSKGDVAHNIRNTLEVAEALWQIGFVPFVPHLAHFWNCMIPHEDTRHKDSFWMAYDFAILAHCDCMIRLPGESVGADMEASEAFNLNIPIFHSVSEAYSWIEAKKDWQEGGG